MKGFTKDGKFHPIKPYNKVRKSRDQKEKTQGVRKARYRHQEQAIQDLTKTKSYWQVVLENPIAESGTTTHIIELGKMANKDDVINALMRMQKNGHFMYFPKDLQPPYLHSIERLKRDGLKKGQRVQFGLIKKGDEVRVSFPEKLRNSEEEGHFGFVTGKKDDKIQVRIKKLKKTILIEPEFLKFVPPPMLEEKFSTIGEIGDDFALSTGDDAIDTREFISDSRAKEFDSYFVKIEDGEITEAYGFNGTGFVGTSATRLETASEMLARSIV